MEACDVEDVLQKVLEDPCFFVNYSNIGRGLVGKKENSNDHNKPYITRTKIINCWRILGDILEKVENYAILFDTETYIFQWIFEISVNDTTNEDTLFFYWKGKDASKGFSPLPPTIENENPVVERICQWSEPALFFHLFTTPLIVFNGSHKKFNPNIKRLFMVRGELTSEIHLYEIPCSKDNLRSRGIFLLLNPDEEVVYFWYGSAVRTEYRQLIPSLINLNERNEYWTNFKITEVKDGCDDDLFLESFRCENSSYIKLPHSADFSPKLLYFNSITGNFLATEIEYPLRSKGLIAPFPFLQSHLYTADQPALFLLVNSKEIWLWEGWKTPESNLDLYEVELQLAKETTNNYAKKKNLIVKHVLAGLEPVEFINIFPYWSKRTDITEIQLKDK